jgi:4-carboxymuconolactone decarboxylase
VPNIPPVTTFDDEQWEILSKTLLDDQGRPLNVFATLAHHPRLLKRFNALGGLFLAKGMLPARERELVILRVAARTRSEYEFGQHTVIGRRTGLADAEIAALDDGGDGLRNDDRLLVRFTDELIDADKVSAATWTAVADAFAWDTAQMIELTLVVGFYRMLAGFLNSAGVEREPGVPGFPATDVR